MKIPTGRIFEQAEHVHICDGSGHTVVVPSYVYHSRLLAWVQGNMQGPLVFVGADGSKCTMRGTGSGADVAMMWE